MRLKSLFSERYLSNVYVALDSVLANKLRSLLTALGIIFGVAAVIAMLAIGNGAQQEILNQIKLVGLNNIVITPIVQQSEDKVSEILGVAEKEKFSPGLTLRDVNGLIKLMPGIANVSPEILIETYLIKNGTRRSAKLVGVNPSYFDITNFTLTEGSMFNENQMEHGSPVCIIGNSIKIKFFPTENPIGKSIKMGGVWLKVIGVLEARFVSEASISNLGIRDYNMDVYTPIQTVLVRYKNRELVTEAMIRAANRDNEDSGDEAKPRENYHQLDRLVVQVDETSLLMPTAEVISRFLERRHFGVIDYEITIPELLLKQQQRTNDIFNFVLGAIAGISLLVGGIGIMNIMLASVMERIKEIGLRLSIGARKEDIVMQFLNEAVLISVSGGIIGVILGITMAAIVSNVAEIPTIISPFSIILSFGVAATVGLIFGIVPAKRAAEQDPITSLRHE